MSLYCFLFLSLGDRVSHFSQLLWNPRWSSDWPQVPQPPECWGCRCEPWCQALLSSIYCRKGGLFCIGAGSGCRYWIPFLVLSSLLSIDQYFLGSSPPALPNTLPIPVLPVLCAHVCSNLLLPLFLVLPAVSSVGPFSFTQISSQSTRFCWKQFAFHYLYTAGVAQFFLLALDKKAPLGIHNNTLTC